MTGDSGNAVARLPRPIHVLVDSSSKRHRNESVVAHLWKGTVPPGSFRRLAKDVYLSSPAFSLMQVATSLDPIALAWAASVLSGLFRPDMDLWVRHDVGDAASPRFLEAQPLTSSSEIERFADRVPGRNGVATLRQTLGYVVDRAASPPEMALAMISAIPRRLGGYGLARPVLNAQIRLSEGAYRLCGRQSLYCDMLFPNRVVVEYDSSLYHASPLAMHDDRNRYNALAQMGYRPTALTSEHLSNTAMLDAAFESVARSMGKRVRPYDAFDRWRREALLQRLLDWNGTLLEEIATLDGE